MERRDFLKLALSSLAICQMPRTSFAKEVPLVAFSEGQDYATITRNILSALGGTVFHRSFFYAPLDVTTN